MVKHRARLERAAKLGVAAVQLAQGQPLRQVATQLGVTHSTLRGWSAAALPVQVAACLATPAGVRWLYQLVVVMHLIITLRAGAGMRLVCQFLELSGLSAVIGASYGRQYAVTVQVQEAVAKQLAIMAFFWASVQSRVDALDLVPDVEQTVLTQLIPALHLERVAGRSTHADTGHRLTALSAQLLAPLRQPTHLLQALAPARRAQIEATAGGCADLFQRSSSHLSLYHHGSHRLSGRKLAALTAMHNFYVRRPDGTTAAERFFERAHPALFDQVLAHVDLPPPARRRRPRPVSFPALTLVAA